MCYLICVPIEKNSADFAIEVGKLIANKNNAPEIVEIIFFITFPSLFNYIINFENVTNSAWVL